MLLLAGSTYFTTSPPVARAPRDPIYPVLWLPYLPSEDTKQVLTPQKFSFGVSPRDAQKAPKDDIEGRSLVIPCFCIQPKHVGCLERSDLLTVTAAGAPYGV